MDNEVIYFFHHVFFNLVLLEHTIDPIEILFLFYLNVLHLPLQVLKLLPLPTQSLDHFLLYPGFEHFFLDFGFFL